jgi:hypothetical protein
VFAFIPGERSAVYHLEAVVTTTVRIEKIDLLGFCHDVPIFTAAQSVKLVITGVQKIPERERQRKSD